MVPSLTVTLPPAGIPRVMSEVFAESGTVPVPIAGEPTLEELEVDASELAVADCTALCKAAVNWALTRSCAVLVAMLAKPFAWLAMRLPIAEISALLAAEA